MLHYHLYCIEPHCDDSVPVREDEVLVLFIDFGVYLRAQACANPACVTTREREKT